MSKRRGKRQAMDDLGATFSNATMPRGPRGEDPRSPRQDWPSHSGAGLLLSFLAVLEMQLTTPELIHAGERVRVLKFEIVPQRK